MAEALPLNEQTIAARLERLPYSNWHITVTAVLGIAIFFDSFDSLTIAYVLPALKDQWHIAPASIGSLISIAIPNDVISIGSSAFGNAAAMASNTRCAPPCVRRLPRGRRSSFPIGLDL